MRTLTYQMLTACAEREIRRHLTDVGTDGSPETRTLALSGAVAVLAMWRALLADANMVLDPERHPLYQVDSQRLRSLIYCSVSR
ncbi:hypothetical protein WL57_05745 [Burkholderia cepacia]|uniref:hypothetical protein n=1 Tax=Burkholderia cepacia TaxID=292 RepID=UPI0007574355|nr:hypothetical protein [Burkholderia cepacia]KAB1588839.1 hypothetical protein C5O75_026500 [Burkholderia cepacia]KWC93258.1 hypothetical protein WL57_05745 [Burkholderia cepacia]